MNIKVNPNYANTKRAFIVDNFYEDPYAVREFALQQEFFDDEGYIGRRTRTQHEFPGLRLAFEEILGKRITNWSDVHGMNARFQINWAGQRLVYHADAQRWGGMLYLTPDAPVSCGTSTWQHRKTKIRAMDEIDYANGGTTLDVFDDRTWVDRTPYDECDKFGNVFNRLVLFDGRLIHSASDYFGVADKHECRLWHMFFFDTD